MNQYRCETCRFRFPGTDHDKCPEDLNNSDARGRGAFYEGIFWFVDHCGCASHSDFQNQRDKVLDELENLFRWTNKEGNFRPWNIGHIEEVIRVYRQKAGE
jgi:hypothetical protein